MTRKPAKPAWWQLPAIIGGCLVGLGAVGTGIVKFSAYLTLPEKVEAGEVKNEEQDKQLNSLIQIQEYWKGIYAAQQAPNQAAPHVSKYWDDEAQRYYCDDGEQAWWVDAQGNCE